ncbi:MAG: hypothetical protein JRN58_04755 [Nitrososphaerota archaeon]|nr:hypothetical protein [Nitrososphaerota archaeon]MDG6967462.1 hypothetical protein [Nitrososphaerota archaeon]MDG6978374.1 hypothetical protein [Nitrososphaerota archaeon]
MLTVEEQGELLHAKHALAPNSLGYCGPDENGRILEHLHDSLVDDALDSILRRFEAAYPFVRMIAKATGRSPFDREVTEAYWIGNPLLDGVPTSEFYEFTYRDLFPSRKGAGKGDGAHRREMRALFKGLGSMARPHHTFYVLGMQARSSVKSGSEAKLLELMDSCRISWGRVVEVKRSGLVVERPRLAMDQARLSLAPPERREVHYDPLIPSFADVRGGDWVSIHWNFASEKLSSRQLANLRRYTALDIGAANGLASAKGR